MRKSVYILAGIAALLVVGFVVASKLYSSSKQQEQAVQAAKRPPSLSPVFIRPHSKSLGPADAKVTVVEFLDPECESCRAMYPIVKHLLSEYPGKVRLVVRYMPFHGNSLYAASALEAAGEQNKYWEMLEIMFLNQPQWGGHHQPRPELIPTYAQQIGLDMELFNKSIANPAHKAKVQMDEADGKSLGVTGTPTFFVNGRQLDQLGYEPLKALIDKELAATN